MKYAAESIKIHIRNLYSRNDGIAMIEFAIMLPIFVLFILGVTEFGLFFAKSEVADSAISNITLTLEQNSHFFDNMPQTQQNQILQSFGSGLVKFTPVGTVLPTSKGNFLCVDAYTSQAAAQNAGICTNSHFNATNPYGANSSNPYYIAVRSNLSKGGITPLVNFVKNTQNIQVAENTGAIQVNTSTPVPCNGPGEALQWTGSAWTCSTFYANCSQPWLKAEFNGSQFICVSIPYIVAGGVAHPTANYGNSAGWIKDKTNRGWWDWPASYWAYPSYQYWTLCQGNQVTFAVPFGLPPGQIITEGNLIYPQPNVNVTWHAWTVSFLNLNVPMLGGTASTTTCMSDGGNWDLLDDVHAEHISWTATYIPNSANGR